MLGEIMNGTAFAVARAALTGLSRRQEAVASNLANVDTPRYQRRQVDFEAALRRSIDGGSSATLARTDPRHLAAATGSPASGGSVQPRDVVSTRNDGNDVSVDEEMTLLVETQIRYQALSQSVGTRLSTLRSVIRG